MSCARVRVTRPVFLLSVASQLPYLIRELAVLKYVFWRVEAANFIGLWHRISNVSDEHASSIFRVAETSLRLWKQKQRVYPKRRYTSMGLHSLLQG
jgi:hypothetical protein